MTRQYSRKKTVDEGVTKRNEHPQSCGITLTFKVNENAFVAELSI